MKNTALYNQHINCGGKMVDFAGYNLPIQYKGIKKEHIMVREKCGMFDVSHMGEILIKGEKAFSFIQHIFTNDFTTLKIGKIRYSPMCYESGGCVDDVLIYKMAEDEFLLVVNASNKDKDYAWMVENNIFNVQITDLSDKISQIALQGPLAQGIAEQCFNTLPKKYYTFCTSTLDDGSDLIISRTGYTGEDGFEIYCDSKNSVIIWDKLLEIGKEDIAPCGLGARDTLRLESGMPLYGQEISKDISPLEAGLNFFVKLNKDCDFIGKTALLKNPILNKRYGIELIDKGITRSHDSVFLDQKNIGEITSGTKSITLEKSIAMAFLNNTDLKIDDEVTVQVRSKMLTAKIVKLPFYKRG